MSRKILFVGWQNTIVHYDSADTDGLGVSLVSNVIPVLNRFVARGYELIAVRNVDVDGSSGDSSALQERAALALLQSQGIPLSDIRTCIHTPDADCNCRLPGLGLVSDCIANLDRENSTVVASAQWAQAFAMNLGISANELTDDMPWASVAHRVLERPRQASVSRRTRETEIDVSVDLDNPAEPNIKTGLAFFDHMLEQLGKHGGFELKVQCKGDLEVDEHHTIEDVAITLGTAIREALDDKRGIARYGFVLPMDEAQAQVSIDLGGRAYLVFDAEFPREEIGGMPTELVEHFFRSLSDALGASLNISVKGENTHHMVEACFKAVARTLRMAKERRGDVLPSTKGTL